MDLQHYQYIQRVKVESRIIQEAQWLLDNPKCSIRKLAKEFMTSKSQVHRDLHELKHIDDDMYVQVMNILKRRRR